MDDVLELTDSFGPFQKKFIAFGIGIMWYFVGVNTMIMIFVTHEPHRYAVCEGTSSGVSGTPIRHGDSHIVPNRGDGHTVSSHDTIVGLPTCIPDMLLEENDCSVPYRYNNPKESITSEWRIGHCEDTPLVMQPEFTTSLYFFGFLIGVAGLGALSDLCGRVTAYLIAITLMNGGTLCSALAHSIYSYGISRTILGMGTGGGSVTSLILVLEFTSGRKRQICTALAGVSFAIGSCMTASVSYVVDEWQKLTIILGIPALSLYIVFCSSLMIESPRWLSSRGRLVESLNVLKIIAHGNGRVLPPELDATCLALLVERKMTVTQLLNKNITVQHHKNRNYKSKYNSRGYKGVGGNGNDFIGGGGGKDGGMGETDVSLPALTPRHSKGNIIGIKDRKIDIHAHTQKYTHTHTHTK
eukprot:GHVR01055393.1.p1 GENE.GHVR01055393.1~~GHVR01055393.1.p1  ORF type:complete len:412 (-),score=108.81 GHVR01055393.1:55-1290(-)